MLKALELAGFKSFAERTRFDFPAGITVVVGPNGSGKSNVIDAIKWVLGEQSVKSLRGKEMVDVIFNGSEARPALNAAETTLTFDNSSGFLPIDSPEVHVGRRVYRNGESEYLINRQVCRLRDIRDLLAGSGIGSHSYSIIEQGKVDMMLQASPQQRRVIFEEAAGISRYKVKKVEAQRRIERVDQNLLRLSDIVQEVETRLRGVKLQAHKAQQYREYSHCLKELRTGVSLVDWRKLSSSHDTAVSQLQGLQDERDTEIARTEQLESRATDLDIEIGQFEEELRAGEVRTSQNRERIAGLQSTIAHHLADEQETHREIDRLMRQQVTMSTRSEDIQQQADQARLGLLTAEKQLSVLQSNLTESLARSTEATRLANQEKSEHAQLQEEHFSCEKEMASLASQLESLGKQRNFTKKQILEKVARTEAISKEVVEHDESVHKLQQEYDSISHRLETESAELIAATNSREDRQRQLERVSGNIAELSHRHGIAAERANVLQELEQRQEGLGAGVRELLQKSRIESDGPLGTIVGLVADLIKVNIESAPAIEAALREKAEYLVVQDARDIQSIVTDDNYSLHGRVGFLWPIESQKKPQSQVDYSTQIGVLGRADDFVDTAPEHKQLANHLLGMTWVVESIEVAFSLLSNNDPEVSFVTLAGECLSADGTLVAGPKQGVAGLISRRSELQALKHQLASLAETLQKDETERNQIKEVVAAEDFRCKELEQQKQQTIELQQRIKIQRATTLDRQSQLQKVLQGLEQELHELKQAEENQANFLHQCQTNRQSISDSLGKLEVDLAAGSSRLAEQEEQDRRLAKEVTDAQVLLARYEQKLESLQARLTQCERDQRERNDSLSESLRRLQDTNERLKESHLTVLNTESELSHLYLRKEALRRENLHFSQARVRLTLERSAVDEELKKSRRSVRALEEKIHERDKQIANIHLQRDALAQRLREDYGIELAELEHVPTANELQQREQTEQEIKELREKINGLGAVNLEALDELESLDERFENLSRQFKDLTGAKHSLEQIINRINSDSRKMFAETLELVKNHFSELFRRLFGGGSVDIVLDEGVDLLDSGIEFVVRPPGKEPRSISLLSGGERTLTSVALLLAIFRSRPGPVCILDEVDAALDEANIERFVGVLKEFLSTTQFIVVTHSKKTMTVANTLYGVTMEESGISKRVSVKFEDISEDGQLVVSRELPASQKSGDHEAA